MAFSLQDIKTVLTSEAKRRGFSLSDHEAHPGFYVFRLLSPTGNPAGSVTVPVIWLDESAEHLETLLSSATLEAARAAGSDPALRVGT